MNKYVVDLERKRDPEDYIISPSIDAILRAGMTLALVLVVLWMAFVLVPSFWDLLIRDGVL